MGNIIDITGKTYGRWEVLGFDRKEGTITYWRLRCECGTERVMPKSGFVYRKGSCGCLKRDFIKSGSRFGSPPAPRRRAEFLAAKKATK